MALSPLNNIKTAIKITEKALADALKFIRPGATESFIAKHLFQRVKTYGGDGFSFRPIVASGSRSALPHGRASNKKLMRGETVVVDFGVKYKGFCSDMTRTFVVGTPSKKQKRIYKILLMAQKKAILAVKAGIPAKIVDKAARDHIQSHGLGKYFIHSTGHGIAKKVHEAPKISKRNGNMLKSGTVVTIEPGIYLKGWGGMRVEDMLLITRSGGELLTKFSRELRI